MPDHIVLVTATWREDLDRFRLLRRSMCEFGLDGLFRHVAAVHTEDVELCADLRGQRNLEIVPTAQLLSRPVERRRAAAHLRRTQVGHWVPGGPIAGWYAQQLTKLACVEVARGAKAIVYLDSDMVVIRPFGPDAFVTPEGRTKFFVDTDMRDDGSAEWNRTAARLVGASTDEVATRQFIHQPAVLDADVAAGLLRHLSGEGDPLAWQAAMLAVNAFEFSTYGAWVARTRPSSLVEAPPMPALMFRLYEDLWDLRARMNDEIDHGTAAFVSVQSRLHIPPSAYEPVVARAWRPRP